ncbi:RagB/SusD family nutrient uptake outer membrane protein [Tunicatimonas pelagia]|uniref:RagB/SusD family nutrient uptake outer membrane protein n=1 Tax=Tunicatimonas pelagia TaxID=931531 RepID=UPI0026670092|nr:RagB/SusD family nutrient uptake outer membrane protein [Tunicatimonas pelagia]WKN42782.1 RagB/SusD family nutrient uptake outer membrane protein [Tunicatimonas pelagia]
MKSRYFVVLLALVVNFSTSCEDFLEEEPKALLSPDVLFSDLNGASIVMISAYDKLKKGWGHRSLVTLVENQSDLIQAKGSWASNSDFDQPLNSVNIGRSNNVWRRCYESINICNTVLAQVENMAVLPSQEEEKAALLGEARFVRALSYYYLVRLYGPVPIRTGTTTTPDEASEGVARTPESEVYDQLIVPDLQFAEQNCVDEWDDSNMGRATRWAAKALLAEVHLTTENWPEARRLAKEVIDSDMFSLVMVNQPDDFLQIYGADVVRHSEEIFSFKYSNVINGIGNWEAQFANGFNGGLYTVGNAGWNGHNANYTNPIVVNWSDDDFRKEFSTYFTIVLPDGTVDSVGFDARGVKHAHIRKWQDNAAPNITEAGNDIPVLRLPDMLLVHAEATAMENGGVEIAEAVESLNQVRRRAYGYDPAQASPIDYPPAGSYAGSFRDSVLVERSYEFFGEAKRWYDLLRTNTTAQAIETAFPELTFNPVRLRFPLPFEEIQNNSEISADDQNLGY